MVVDGRRRQPGIDQVLLPGGDIAAQAGARAVVAVGVRKEGDEAGQVEDDLLGDFLRAHADDGEAVIAVGPDGQAVGGDRQRLASRRRLAFFTFVK
jgi:hypothetical protein